MPSDIIPLVRSFSVPIMAFPLWFESHPPHPTFPASLLSGGPCLTFQRSEHTTGENWLLAYTRSVSRVPLPILCSASPSAAMEGVGHTVNGGFPLSLDPGSPVLPGTSSSGLLAFSPESPTSSPLNRNRTRSCGVPGPLKKLPPLPPEDRLALSGCSVPVMATCVWKGST